MVPETSPDTLANKLHQPFVGRVQAPLRHDMLCEVMRGEWFSPLARLVMPNEDDGQTARLLLGSALAAVEAAEGT